MSIKVKLSILFPALVSIPLLFMSIVTFTDYKTSLQTNRLLQLQDLARFKAERVEAYFAGLKTQIEMAENFYNIKKNLPVLNRFAHDPLSHGAAVAREMLDGQLQGTQKVLKLADIMLADNQGRIVYVSNPAHYGTDLSRSLDEFSPEAFKASFNQVGFSEIFLNILTQNNPEILLTAPAFDLNNRQTGVIIFEIDMAPLYGLIADTTGLGYSGEVLIGKKISESEILYLNPLRRDSLASLQHRVRIGGLVGLPIQKAVSGQTGIGMSVDYRGKKVISAWRYIPSVAWGLVAKIDSKEAFAAITNLQRLMFMILAVTLAMTALISFSVVQSISRPIQKLTQGAAIIGGGNLEYRVGTNLKDEIGQLSRSFDKMTHDLKTITASRNELNNEIAERKKAEEALRRSAEDLTRSNKDLEQFAYVASHDLQEPLRAVSGFVELLKQELKSSLNAKTTEYIDFSIDGARRMQSLINGLLEYSRVGTRGNQPIRTNAKAALDDAIAGLRTSIKESDAKISAGDLPMVYFDGLQLSQLFQNLLGNAIKFRGEQAPLINISAGRAEDSWRIAVKDNGIGIEQQYADRIFMIFQRLHGREKYPGTGIGLAICKKIVERHNGKIWVESTPGTGSTFYFTIPDKGENA